MLTQIESNKVLERVPPLGPNDISDELLHTPIEATNEFASKTTEKDNLGSKKTVFCYYCESYVLHFPRHISINHKAELEVQKILALPALSKQRKKLLYSLRKKVTI